MFKASAPMLRKAMAKGYALPAFNTCNLEVSRALFEAAEEARAPLLIQTTESAISYAGLENIFNLIKSMEQDTRVPVCIHLDHGRNLKLLNHCLALGYKSVMVDASKKPFKKNVAITRKVVRVAHSKNCSVEAELGALGKIGEVRLTNPLQAKEFVQKTGCDALAVAIGTSHGAYKFRGKPKIDLQRLQEISELVPSPLVLHGASAVPGELVKKANRYGAKLHRTAGVPGSQLKKAVKLGVAKVNIDTDLRLAFTASLRQFLAKNPSDFDPRDALAFAQREVKRVAVQKIRLLGAKNRAK